MYLLDTDTLTRFHHGYAPIAERLREVGEENVATSVITEVEILRGRHEFLLKASNSRQLLRAQDLLQQSKSLLAEITILPMDAEAAAVFDRLSANKKLKKIGRADLLIAASPWVGGPRW
jgi:tRNA(fMet)-specific endonuclease VapC